MDEETFSIKGNQDIYTERKTIETSYVARQGMDSLISFHVLYFFVLVMINSNILTIVRRSGANHVQDVDGTCSVQILCCYLGYI